MTTDVDSLVSEFRADQPGPDADAVQRILKRSLAPEQRGRRLRRVMRRPVAFIPALCTTAVAALAVTLFWPGGDRPGLLDRAAAAIAPVGEIVHLTFTVDYEQREQDGAWTSTEVVTMHDWTLYDGDRFVRMRRFISTGPLTRPPTDEDTSVVLRRDGTLQMRSWVDGDVRTSAEGIPPLEQLSVAGALRAQYETGVLEVASRDAERIVLRAIGSGCESDSSFAQVVVDATSFLPSEAIQGPCRDSGAPAGVATIETRQVWRFRRAETLLATAEGRAVLEIGAWPLTPVSGGLTK